MKYASAYKRIEVAKDLLYVNVSKQGVSVSVGPRGAKLHVPIYDRGVKRKPKIWLQKHAFGARFQYRRNLEDRVDE